MKENRIVTIIIPTRNRPTHLALCISSLLNQSFRQWDLVIANDGDGGLEEVHLLKGIFNLIKFKGHRLKIISTYNSGQDGALNAAHKAANTDLILRIDDDAWLEPDYLELLNRCILADEKIGAVGGNVPNVYHSKEQLTGLSRELEELAGRIVFKDGHFVSYERQSLLPEPDEQPYEVAQLRGHFLYRQKILDKIGGFPTVYSQMGRREDTDTSIRIKMAGYRLFVVPQAIAWHIHSPFGGTRDGIDKSNYQKYLQMEEDDVRLFENRMWKWVSGGFRGFVIPDEKVKLRRLRYLLNKYRRSIREARSINLNEILEVVKLKKECLFRLTDEDMLYLLLFKIMTTAERDEIKGGDRL